MPRLPPRPTRQATLRESDPRVMFERATRAQRSANLHRARHVNRMDSRRLEALFRQEPLLKRGIVKHAGDLVKGGFLVVEPGTMEEHDDNKEVQSWWRRHHADQKFKVGLVSGHVYGDGILEYEWDDGGASTAPRSPTAELQDIHPVDPVDVEFEPMVREADGVPDHFLLQRVAMADPVRLHPDRYSHLRLTNLVGFKHGFSTVENAWHAAISKVKGDQALGEMLFYGAQPKTVFSIDGGTPEEIQTVMKFINSDEFLRGFGWDERLDVEQLNPVALDPAPPYKVLAESIAAAIGLPMPMLIGAQAGSVTGSETNLEDYHADLQQVQETVLTEPVARIVEGITGRDPDDFDIYWPPLPMLRGEQATAIRDRVIAFQGLVANKVEPMAAARIAGLELSEDDIMEAAEGALDREDALEDDEPEA